MCAWPVPVCVTSKSVYLCMYTRATASMWRSENNFWELILSFYHVGPGNETQVIRLCGNCFYPKIYLSGPLLLIIINKMIGSCVLTKRDTS